jgi:hypothetical protein
MAPGRGTELPRMGDVPFGRLGHSCQQLLIIESRGGT